MKISLLLAILLCFSASACTPEAKKAGKTIDEVEILDPSDPHPGGDDSADDVNVTQAMITTAGATELMVTKAAAYRKASMAAGKRNGVYVYDGASFTPYVSNPEKLAARIAMLGFKDVYLSPGKSRITEASPALKRFIAACSGYGISVYAVRISNLSVLVNPSEVNSEVSLITSYNSKVAPNERFKGIAADLEPHTAKGSAKPSGLQYTWDSNTNYGKGGDNDQLLHLTLDRLSAAGTQLHNGGLKLGEAILYTYQRYFNQGQLEYGSAPQFLDACDFLIIMAYVSTKEGSWSESLPCLQAASSKPSSVSICIKTRINEDSGTSIQAKGWNYLLETVKYLNQQGASQPAFRGVDMFTFDGIETMWEWLNDKN